VLDAGTGTVLRSVPVGNDPTWMAADERTGRLFVVVLGIGPANSLTVRTLDTTTGAVLHSVTLLRSSTAGGSVWLGPDAIAVDAQAGRVFLVNRISYPPAPTLPRLWVLDARRGTLVRTLRLPTAASAVVVAPRTHHAFVASASKPAMWMLDADTGALRRTIPLPGVPSAMAVDSATDEVLIVNPTAAGTVSVFDGRTGRRQRSIPAGAYPSTLLLDERRGRAFVLDQAAATPAAPGSISTIVLRRGRLLRTVGVGVHPVAMAADERAGRVFILNQETSTRRGTVNVLAATTGQVLKIIAVGYQPSALAVDESTGHDFVTSQSASVPGHGAFAALIERVQEFMAVNPGSSRGIVTILNAR
jgi:DNA-binding beta-propeller fold protein YncE